MSVDLDSPRLTLGHFLEDATARAPDACAIRFEGRSWRYAEVLAESRRLARGLVGAGVVKGARVAVYMGNRPEWVVSAFAVAMAGGVLVPVNTFATAEERDYILRHSDASFLLLQPGLLKHRFLEDLERDHPELASDENGRLRCAALPQLRRIACLGEASWSELLDAGDDVPDAILEAIGEEIVPSDDGLIIYTSGTTANPKGVLHTHRAAVVQSHRFADLLRFDAQDRVWTCYPFFWTAGIAMSLGATFAAGATLILQEHFEPGAALELMENERATAAHAWAHQHKAMGEDPTLASRDLASLRKLDPGNPLAARAGVTEDEYSPNAAYGLSETFTIASMVPADAALKIRRGTSGKALPGTLLRIVHPETGEPVAPGEEGEIAVKGVTFMRGYYKVAPEKTVDENGFFRTQDGGRIDSEGFLHWTGRLSNLIKTGGANVSPIEIENVASQFDALRVGLAVGIPHPTLGEAVVLCAVATEGADLDEEAVRTFLRGKLAAYKVPRRVLFFGAEELSYTGTQKIQVGPLREKTLERLAGQEIDGHTY